MNHEDKAMEYGQQFAAHLIKRDGFEKWDLGIKSFLKAVKADPEFNPPEGGAMAELAAIATHTAMAMAY